MAQMDWYYQPVPGLEPAYTKTKVPRLPAALTAGLRFMWRDYIGLPRQMEQNPKSIWPSVEVLLCIVLRPLLPAIQGGAIP